MPATRPRPIPDLMASMSAFSALDEQALRQIRKTAEDPPRVSVYDVLQVVAGVAQHHCTQLLKRLQETYPEVHTVGVDLRATGQLQHSLEAPPGSLS